MKTTLFVFILTCCFAVRGEHYLGLRVSPYKNFEQTYLLEIFHFDSPQFLDSEKMERCLFSNKPIHDLPLPNWNESNGIFSFENGKVVWWKDCFIIQPDDFSFELKNSKREIKLSGNIVRLDNNLCDLELKSTMSYYMKTDWYFRFSSSFSLKMGQISIIGGSGDTLVEQNSKETVNSQ